MNVTSCQVVDVVIVAAAFVVVDVVVVICWCYKELLTDFCS